MLRQLGFVPLTMLVLSLVCRLSGTADAASSSLVPANVQFVYRTGDRVTNDAYGPLYQDGQLGVSCDFHDPASGGTGDLTFHTSSPGGSQNTRTLNFLFGTPLMPCRTTPGGQVPTSKQGASLTVTGIYGMPVGSSLYTRAFFFLSEGTLRYASTNYCANEVLVTHSDARTWWISSTPTGPGVGDLAVMIETVKGQSVPTYYWEMPFQIEATLQ